MTRTDRMTGTIRLSNGTIIAITDELIVNNSVTLREQLVRGDVFQIGTFYTNELDIAIFDEDVSRSYANAVITPFYELLLPDGAWEQVKLGKFTVDNSASVRKGEIRRLKAFDDSIRFDVDISGYLAIYSAKNTVAGHIRNICSYVGVALATADLSAFPNSDVETDISKSSSVQTCRDVIEYCSALMGCSARITRDSRLEILQLVAKISDDNEYIFDAVIGGDERRGTDFFDLRALIKYVNTTINGSAISYTTGYTLSSDELGRNAIVTVDTNPLLENLDATDEEKKEIFINSTASFKNVLRQAEFSFIGNSAIECFDTIAISGGQIDLNRTLAVFPTKSVWKYRSGHSISCASAELTDESTLISEAVMLADETEPIKTPSAVRTKTDKRIDGIQKDKKVDIGIILTEKAMQSVCHNYTEIGYISGNSVGYGDTLSAIICNGVLINSSQNRDYQNGSKYKYLSFPKGHSFNATGVSTKIESVTDIVVDVAVETVYDTYKNLRSQITVTNAGNGGRANFTLARFSANNGEDYAVFPYWDRISPPSEDYPYGSVQINFDTIVCEDGVWERQYTQFGAYLYVSFASEAEYNAAIGLTSEPLERAKLQDFQYLVPESQIIVDKELSEGSDNVIANSTVAKALSLKAEKSEVQSISQAVEGKAEQSEVTALSEDYNASKTDFDTRIRKLATASANHGIILNEHADELLLKADKTEVTALQSDVTELQKSRRNYIYNSAFLYGSDGWVLDTNCAVDKTRLYNCHPTVKLNQTGLSAAAYNGVSSTALPIKDKSEMKSGELWNFSCKYYAEDISTIDQPILFQIQGIAEGATALSVIAQRSVAADGITAGEWQEMSFSFTPAQNYSACMVNCFLIQNGVLWFADFKLEKNNKSTEWIPAYEDAGLMAERVATLEAALLSLGGEV